MKQISKVGKVFLRQIIRKQIVDRSNDNRDNIQNGAIKGTKFYYVSIGSRLSKLQIQLALYLHSLDIDSNGIIRRVYYKEAAKALNCSEKSIKNNIVILHRRYLIDYVPVNSSFCSVLLPAYKTYHLEGFKGGEGYIDIPDALMIELLSCKTVNEIRLSICQLLNLDKQRLKQEKELVEQKNEIEAIIDIKEFKYGMPNYLNSTPKIKELIKNISFTKVEYIEDIKARITLNKEYNYISYRQKLSEEYYIRLKYDLEYISIDFTIKQLTDLIQMCVQYSYEEVLHATILFDAERFISEYDEVDKYCGYIRNIIKRERSLKERVA